MLRAGLFPKADFEVKDKLSDALVKTLALLLKKSPAEILRDDSAKEMLRLAREDASVLEKLRLFAKAYAKKS